MDDGSLMEVGSIAECSPKVLQNAPSTKFVQIMPLGTKMGIYMENMKKCSSVWNHTA